MRKIIVVYNPRSSRYIKVEKEILEKVRGERGVMVGKFEIQPTNPRDNANNLARIIGEGDLVLAAGGDGTATITMNGVILAREKYDKEGIFSCFSYGNFNDLARSLGDLKLSEVLERFKENKTDSFYPLEILVNKRLFWYSGSYFTMGMFGESTQVFEDSKIRRKLKTGEKGLFFSAWNLFVWYLRNKRREFLGEMTINGKMIQLRATDYVALNGSTLARVVKVPKSLNNKEYFLEKEIFFSGVERFVGFLRLFRIGFIQSFIRKKLPGEETDGDLIKFKTPMTVFLHAEGEAREFKGVSEVFVRKLKKPIKVIRIERRK